MDKMDALSRIGDLHGDQLGDALSALRDGVESYLEHTKRDPRPGNERRENRIAIMNQIKTLANDFESRVYNPKEQYIGEATFHIVDDICAKQPKLDKTTVWRSLLDSPSYQKTLNELSIGGLGKVISGKKDPKDIVKSVLEHEAKAEAKPPKAEKTVKRSQIKLP